MLLEELLQLLSAEYKSAASLILLPVPGILIGVVPEEVCHQAAVGHVRWLGDLLDLLKTMHVLRDTSVHTHDLLVDQGYQWHVIKAIPELLPEWNLVPSLDLVEESINPGDGL